MDVACSDMTGLDHQRKGFHTFLMTGDAIIRTNFNPFKPTRQLSLDSQPQPDRDKPKTERSVSNVEIKTQDSFENNNDDEDNTDSSSTSVSPTSHKCSQNKQFIPGFMTVDEQSEEAKTNSELQHTEDSGIDVRLSADLESAEEQSGLQAGNEEEITQSDQESVAIDEPSARRLATRLYQLDGFKLSDVCHYLSKSDDFTHKVVEEFMNYFDFSGHSLVDSLRSFLCQISLEGDMNKEKEIVLLHFTKRYLDCNRGGQLTETFHSEDSCHTLVCALVLLNADLHNLSELEDQKVSRKLFIENLCELNDGQDFPKQFLTTLFDEVRCQPLYSANCEEEIRKRLSDAISYGVEPLESDPSRCDRKQRYGINSELSSSGLHVLKQATGTENMKSYLLKKHCKGPNGVKTPSRKRGWKRHYVILKDLRLILQKSDKRTHRSKSEKCINLENAYATIASYYTKRKNGFTVTTSDGCEYLFIAGNKEVMEDWIYTINLTTACYSKHSQSISTPPLGSSTHFAPVGSHRHMRDQLKHYEQQMKDVGNRLLASHADLLPKGAIKEHVRDMTEGKLLQQQYLQKYTAYVNVLKMHLDRYKPRSNSVTKSIVEEVDSVLVDDAELYLAGSRLSYRLAVYGTSEDD